MRSQTRHGNSTARVPGFQSDGSNVLFARAEVLPPIDVVLPLRGDGCVGNLLAVDDVVAAVGVARTTWEFKTTLFS
jgi:hypothetical protein